MREISSHEQLDCLGVPVRQEVLDAVQALQPCSVREIAAHLKRSKTALYHHIEKLLAVRLIKEEGYRATGRRPEMLYAVPHTMTIGHQLDDPVSVDLVKRIVAGMTSTAARDFANAYRSGVAVTDGSHRNTWAARLKLWLSKDELARLGATLTELTTLLENRATSDRELHTICWVLTPND